MCEQTNLDHEQPRGSADLTRGRRRTRGARGAPDPCHPGGSEGRTRDRGPCLAPVTQAHSLMSETPGYLLDWITTRLPLANLDADTARRLENSTGRILKIAADGSVEWESGARETVRHDSHRVVMSVNDAVTIQGSPARCADGDDNVFGSADIVECWQRMTDVIRGKLNVDLPNEMWRWTVTRVDIAANYDMASLSNVRAVLEQLRHCEGGRYQVRCQAESVYWSPRSRLRSGKAYAKGPELRRRVAADALIMDEAKQAKGDRLVRLELKLGAQYLRERAGRKWWTMAPVWLAKMHQEYFAQFLAPVQVHDGDDLYDTLCEQAKERGRTHAAAMSAYRTWLLVRDRGIEQAKQLLHKPTWHRHKRQLFDAGLTWGHLKTGVCDTVRTRVITLGEPVSGWDAIGSAE